MATDNRRLIYSVSTDDKLDAIYPIDIVDIDCSNGFTELNNVVENYRKMHNYEHIWADLLEDIPLDVIDDDVPFHLGWVKF